MKSRDESCSLRIFGEIGDLDRISHLFGVMATYTHRKGERRSERTPPHRADMCLYQPRILENASIEEQLVEICRVFRPHHDKIRDLLRDGNCTVDLYCGYRATGNQGGFDLTPESLELSCRLGLRIAISVWD